MDYSLLGLGEATSIVTHIQINRWGNDVLVSCLYNPLGSSLPYQLIFKDCKEINWQIVDPDNQQESTADLIGFFMGAEHHQKPAVITTDIFELSITYGSFVLKKADETAVGVLTNTSHSKFQT